MMIQQLFKKWWLLLIQGILLITLSVYIFNNPVEVLTGISLWVGIIVLATGVLGILSWWVANGVEKDIMSLFWSVVTAIFGLVILLNALNTMKALTVIFGLWILLTSIHLIQSGWVLKKVNSIGWLMVLAGIISSAIAIMIIFNTRTGAVAITTLLGLQVLFTGIALVLLAFAKRVGIGIKES